MHNLIPTDITQAITPAGFTVACDGVYYDKSRITATPTIALARGRDFASESWTLLVAHLNPDGIWKTHQIPFISWLNQREYVSQLANGGLIIAPGSQGIFASYLVQCAALDDLPIVRIMDRLGLFSHPGANGEERLGFLLPGITLYPNASEAEQVGPILFQPKITTPAHKAYEQAGTLEEWKAHIAGMKGNTGLVLACVASLGAPFLNAAGIDNFGLNLYGPSSTGKTLALQGFASVWGCGSDPQYGAGRAGLIERWNSTANGMEAMMAAYNGMGMAIDELGSNVEAAISIYNCVGGQGKFRMTETGEARKQHKWSTLVLSSGEIGMAERIQEVEQRTAKTGELIRMLDVPVGELPIRDNLSADERRTHAEALKQNLGKCYGSAGPAFAQEMLTAFQTKKTLEQHFADDVKHYHELLLADLAEKGFTLTPATKRALRRFGFLCGVGLTAIALDILPLTNDEFVMALTDTVEAWLTNMPRESDEETVLEGLRDFVLRYRSQIISTDAPAGQPRRANMPRRGLLHRGLLLLDEVGMREACGNTPINQAAKVIRSHGMLRTEARDKLTYRVTIASMNITKGRFYAIDYGRLMGANQAETEVAA
ncbi:protein of unknown function [Magnetospirillum gryphiswaldense MSR-1 v2]|uniref:DUF927 domain-containing protein n=1 Tax=Magnetospirillum gryphiswaldense (strain DSM 6361 / JCM 21280 / NBRC 15271 / MSR-1) TaxID=431944 RepID=V6EYE3_MAGGM|nr:DUF927 domain-containing protein [Magnetospirillum gryphiswaldense]CDK97228.1 protein of unknown function [Magnetospirillum gryphiswaldense MSR-1 v2]